MPKVLVSGLALGSDVGVCLACNYDFGWILRYPSTLIWADEILVPDVIWEVVESAAHPRENPELARSLRIIFQAVHAAGVVRTFDPAKFLSEQMWDEISRQVDSDRQRLAEAFPHDVSLGDDDKVPGQIFVDGIEYCAPALCTTYASFVLSRGLKAECFFSSQVLRYSRFQFCLPPSGGDGPREQGGAFQAVLQSYLPNRLLFPEYAYIDKERCATCAKEPTCRQTLESRVEGKVAEVLRWRDYDEIQQLKAAIGDLVRRRDAGGGVIDPQAVLTDFRQQEAVLRRRIRRVFPRIRRWANVATIVSIPVALAGLAAGSGLLTLGGGTLAGLSQIAKEAVDLLTSRHSWIGFTVREADTYRPPSREH